jgi:hypothetical protein
MAASTGFPALRRWLLEHPAALDELRGLEREVFIGRALQTAAGAGITLRRSEIEHAIAAACAERARRLL